MNTDIEFSTFPADMCKALLACGLRPDLGAARGAYEAGPLPFNSLVTNLKHVQRGSGKTPIHAGMHFNVIIRPRAILVYAAAGQGHFECMLYLINTGGASYGNVCKQGMTAEEWAKHNGQSQCGDYLALRRWKSRTVPAKPGSP